MLATLRMLRLTNWRTVSFIVRYSVINYIIKVNVAVYKELYLELAAGHVIIVVRACVNYPLRMDIAHA